MKAKLLKPLIFFTIAIVIALIVIFGYWYVKYLDAKGHPQTATQDEIQEITGNIQKFMDLPTDEVPTLGTIADKNKVQSQAFFAHAENGDKLLIYTQNNKAILYRPSTNHVIEVGPFVTAPTPTPSSLITTPALQATADKVSVAIYNGSKTRGLAAATQTQLTDYPQLTFVQKTNSQKNYTQTLVIDLNGKETDLVAQIAKTLNAQVGPIPDGEKTPTADILIIAGK